jgi:hypothetical protein
MPAKRPWADVAAYSSPLTESVDVVAAIAAAGPAPSAAAAARTGTIHPCQRMTYRTSSRPAGRTPGAASVVKASGLARPPETAAPAACRCGQGTAGGSSPPEGPARCLAAGSGAARARRWWQVARLSRPPRQTSPVPFTAKAGPGRRPLSCRHGLAGVARWATSSPVRAAVSPPAPMTHSNIFGLGHVLDLSPATESNRRPSPYHRVPIDALTRHFAGRPGQTLHFSSVGRDSGQFAPDAASQIPPNR